MDEPISQDRKNKTITLSVTTISTVGMFAEENNLSFSHALEKLALSALKGERPTAIMDLLRHGVRHEMARQHNRFAKLFAFNAMESSTAKETTSAVFIWTLQERYRDYADQLRPGEKPTHQGFQAFMRLKKDSPEAEILMAEIKRRLAGYRTRAVKNLRSPMDEYRDILDEMDQYLNDAEGQLHWVSENGSANN